jgi:glycosyltransferase involved in cell wall biosynthesis
MKELRILHPDQIYPQKSGGLNRTIQLAKLAVDEFHTTIFGIAENEFDGYIGGIRFLQEKKFHKFSDKLKYLIDALFSEKYSIINSKEPIKNNLETTVFQIEGPYLFNYLMKNGIENYVLDEQNVYWELLKFPSYNLRTQLYKKINFKRDKLMEIKAIKNAFHVLACSERDKQTIIEEIPESEGKITVIPNCVDLSSFECDNILAKENSILFVGLLSYPPNQDALNIICNILAPKLEQFDFNIIGKNPSKVNKPTNVNFLGYVDDVGSHILENEICIAPLRYGSGTRLKILEYMAMGKPVISTSKGAEGIDYTNNKNIIIEDNFNNFAIRIKELAEDEKQREYLGKNARKLIEKKYDWNIYEKPLRNIYKEVFDGK